MEKINLRLRFSDFHNKFHLKFSGLCNKSQKERREQVKEKENRDLNGNVDKPLSIHKNDGSDSGGGVCLGFFFFFFTIFF